MEKKNWCPETQAKATSGIEEKREELRKLREEVDKKEGKQRCFIDEEGYKNVRFSDRDVEELYMNVAEALSEYDTEVAHRVIDILAVQKEDYLRRVYCSGAEDGD